MTMILTITIFFAAIMPNIESLGCIARLSTKPTRDEHRTHHIRMSATNASPMPRNKRIYEEASPLPLPRRGDSVIAGVRYVFILTKIYVCGDDCSPLSLGEGWGEAAPNAARYAEGASKGGEHCDEDFENLFPVGFHFCFEV